MGHAIFLGQEIGAHGTISYDPASKTVSWSTSGVVAQILVNGSLFASGTSGRAPASWVQPGTSYTFQLLAPADEYHDSPYEIASVTVDESGIAAAQSSGGVPPTGPNLLPSVSWFDQTTEILGSAIPNLYLAAGGGLILLAAVAAKKKR